MENVPIRVEPECLLDEGAEWVVGCSTKTVDSSPSTESMDSWAATPSTDQRTCLYLELKECPYIHLFIYVRYLPR